MTINITEPVAQWLLDYDVKQLRRDRRATAANLIIAALFA
jgi:hypothetical protein